MFKLRVALACSLATLASSALAQTLADPHAAFGAREQVQSIAMSSDGRTVAYVQPMQGQGAAIVAADLSGAAAQVVTTVDGRRQRLGGCDFVAGRRLVCDVWAILDDAGTLVPVTRSVALNIDGGHLRVLGERDTPFQLYVRATSGHVIDYLPGNENAILMAQTFIPEAGSETRLARRREGLGVVRVDTETLKTKMVEAPDEASIGFVTDGRGNVRMKLTRSVRGATGLDSPTTTFWYRPAAGGNWKEFSEFDSRDNSGMWPVAVDPGLDAAYVFESLNGRDALYRVKLDGTMGKELVASHDHVDVDGLVRIGRSRRVVGVSYATDKREVVYFDQELRKLAQQLRQALPNLPLIHFADASEDESRLLIWAGSDTDPGRYYTYDKATRRLNEIMLVRPELENTRLAAMRPISFPAADGTKIPGYLTLPPGKESAEGLPALVLPHGGPEARDEWGFDWLAQYFAHQGYAVLQPNFRGSAGYGEAWFRTNGFQSWRTAIGDVNDAGRWLLTQGVQADKLGIFGWSYGGYAALQSNVLEPDLYKAVVAVAQVTDIAQARDEWRGFTNHANVREYFGNGPHVQQGSPAQNARSIKAPVLMFHGDRDRNVSVRQSQLMEGRLRSAGKKNELIVYPGLDHQLDDSAARTDMLRRSNAFLREALGLD